MSTKFKVGDKVRILSGEYSLGTGLVVDSVHEVREVRREGRHIYLKEVDTETERLFLEAELELVPEEPVKGTLERLQIEACPQGGYSVIAPGSSWGAQPMVLSAHTTINEALAFIGRNMR